MATKRVDSLDTFRGITSFLIMMTHYLLSVPSVCKVENLGAIFGAMSWKLPYFFILSGFVLTLSFRRLKEQSSHPYLEFLRNRFFRIYPLFFVVTIVAALIRLAYDGVAPVEGASVFFNIPWKMEWSPLDLLNSLTLVGNANTWLFNNPGWTLPFEMRYALIFPLLYAMLRWRNFTYVVFVALAAAAIYVNSGIECVDIFYATNFQLSNFCSMLTFMLPFAAGMSLAFNREKLSSHYLALGGVARCIYLAVAVVLAITPVWAMGVIPESIYGISSNLMIIVGVVMWVVLLLNNETITKIFSHPLLVRLGRSSFSMYLWHMPIFTLLYMSLHQSVNVWWLVAISVVLTVVVAQLSFRYIESYFINLNKRL